MVRVMLASPAPEWLTDSPQAADAGSQEALISRLRQLAPNQGAADMPKALQAAIKGEPAGKEATRFVTVITDGQAHGWRADATAEWAAIFALSQRARPPVVLRAVLAAADSGPVSNLAVEKLTAARAVAAVGQPVALTATVKNTGGLNSEAGSLAWTAGGQSIGLSAVPALDPGAETTVTLSQPFPNPGLVDISCQLSGHDDLSLDDSARFLLNVTESAPILVVEGESHFDPLQSDSAYFLSALGWQASGESAAKTSALASIFRPKLINYQKLDSGNPRLLSMRGPGQRPPSLRRHRAKARPLRQFRRRPLDRARATKPKSPPSTSSFFASGAGLSPASLKQPVGDAMDREKFTALSPPSADHPATVLLADTHRLDIDHVRVFRRHQLDTGGDKSISVLLRAEGGSAPGGREDFRPRPRHRPGRAAQRLLEQPALVPVLRRHGPRVALVFDRIGHGPAQSPTRRVFAIFHRAGFRQRRRHRGHPGQRPGPGGRTRRTGPHDLSLSQNAFPGPISS